MWFLDLKFYGIFSYWFWRNLNVKCFMLVVGFEFGCVFDLLVGYFVLVLRWFLFFSVRFVVKGMFILRVVGIFVYCWLLGFFFLIRVFIYIWFIEVVYLLFCF